MEPNIFKFVWRYSKRQQVILLVLTAISFPFLYLSLELPKTIVNEAIGGTDFPKGILSVELDQIAFLFTLSAAFLILVFVNGGFKYAINVYRGVVGERMLRRLRYQLIGNVLRFPMPHFRRVSEGEVVSMVFAETEPLGGFISSCWSLPAFQGGTLLTILVFMFVQDWVLGLAAISLYPLQAWLIPKLQRKLNLLKKERVLLVRKLSERVGEVVSSVQEIHAHDTSQLELADFSKRLGSVYRVRYQIYKQKFLIKFLNNFAAQVTPFFFYSIGGYLVISGRLTLGALVATLAAYKDLSAPWKELLNHYQVLEDARIKYDLLIENFQPEGLMDASRLESGPTVTEPFSSELVASNLSLREEADSSEVAGATFKLPVVNKVAIVGNSGSGAQQLAGILAGLNQPVAGSLSVDGHDVHSLPDTVLGRRLAYVSQETKFRSGTLYDNLVYSLKHRPTENGERSEEARARLHEAALAGNSPYDIDDDWIDYKSAGVDGPEGLTLRLLEVLKLVEMDGDVYGFGLNGVIDPDDHPELVERILQARSKLRDRLKDPAIAPLVELFDAGRYNTNLSVAENLLFGTPRDEALSFASLHTNAYVLEVLEKTHLMNDFLKIGRSVAELMVDLFADVPPDSKLFEQFSFISADDLPEFGAILNRTEPGQIEGLTAEDRTMMLALPFKLVPARHRLGLIDDDMQARILEARRTFAEGLGAGAPNVEFYHPDIYSPQLSIQDNILFGRLAYDRARSAQQVGVLIGEVVDDLGLRKEIMQIGLQFEVGIGASRLSVAQRQKLAIARCLLKRPDLLIVNEATAHLDGATQMRIMKNLFEESSDRGLVWVLHRPDLAAHFDKTLVLDDGTVVQLGHFDQVNQPGTLLGELVAQE